jgi:hypothetical protein
MSRRKGNGAPRATAPATTPEPAIYYKTPVTPEEAFQAIGRLRKEARDEIDRLIQFLDKTDDYVARELEDSIDDNPHDEETDDNGEDNENADPAEPSLGSVGDVHFDQERWATGSPLRPRAGRRGIRHRRSGWFGRTVRPPRLATDFLRLGLVRVIVGPPVHARRVFHFAIPVRLETGPQRQQNCTDCHKENTRPVRFEPQESHAAPSRLQSAANRPAGIRR